MVSRISGSLTGQPCYTGSDYEVRRGIDVSEHQLEIDWAQAAADIDFAFIRLGYRGYTEGGLFEDPYFKANIEGAIANGLDVGVYFFSQAVNVQEAIEEAEFVLERIREYDISLPVVFDWEKIEGEAELPALIPRFWMTAPWLSVRQLKTPAMSPASISTATWATMALICQSSRIINSGSPSPATFRTFTMPATSGNTPLPPASPVFLPKQT